MSCSHNLFCIETSHVYLSNRPHFLWVYRRDNPRGMLGEHEKTLKVTNRLYPSHGPLRFITSHSRFALASAMPKNEAPEEEAATNGYFPKGLTHGFGQKIQHFLKFLFE